MAEPRFLEDRFIDADEHYDGDEKSSFERIINNQMQKCADVLSKEYVGGYMKKTKNEEVYVEDVRLALINSVDVLKRLLMPFLKEKDKEAIKKILSEIEEYKKTIGEEMYYIKGRGKMKVKDIGMMPVDSPHMKKLNEFRANKYRELFELLIVIYSKYKTDIAALSTE